MGRNADIGYILSLGVHRKHRRNGIGSLLLDSLLNHLTTAERHSVKAIFLHVLTTNQPAIQFYEKRRYYGNFSQFIKNLLSFATTFYFSDFICIHSFPIIITFEVKGKMVLHMSHTSMEVINRGHYYILYKFTFLFKFKL